MHCSIFKIPFSLSCSFTRKFSFPRSLWQLVYYITSSRTCQVNNLWTRLFSPRFLNGQLIYYIISNKFCQVNKMWTRTAFRSLPHLLYSLAILVRQLYYYSMILPDCQAKLSLSFHLIYIIFVQWYSEVLPFIGCVPSITSWNITLYPRFPFTHTLSLAITLKLCLTRTVRRILRRNAPFSPAMSSKFRLLSFLRAENRLPI